MNIQPSVVEAGFDVRVPPVAEMGAFMNKRIAEEWAPKSRNMSYYVSVGSVTFVPDSVEPSTESTW